MQLMQDLGYKTRQDSSDLKQPWGCWSPVVTDYVSVGSCRVEILLEIWFTYTYYGITGFGNQNDASCCWGISVNVGISIPAHSCQPSLPMFCGESLQWQPRCDNGDAHWAESCAIYSPWPEPAWEAAICRLWLNLASLQTTQRQTSR